MNCKFSVGTAYGIKHCVPCFSFVVNEGFGLASHLGVLSGIPCVGVAKKLFRIDGLERNPAFREKVRALSVHIVTNAFPGHSITGLSLCW